MPIKPILIVDDEPIVRESLKDWLEDAGYKVVTAEAGEQALELIAEKDFSVVILDIRLPGRTGIAVLKELKEKKPELKAIIITAYPTSNLTAEALQLGAIDYLVKPIAPDDLERLVREAVRSSQSKTMEAI
jgi:DNA-binding NtrC family response regulator